MYKNGEPLIVHAIMTGRLQAAAALIELRCDINATGSITPKQSALHAAVLKQHLAIVKLILDRTVDLDLKDTEQKTALDYAEQIHHSSRASSNNTPQLNIDDSSNPAAAIYFLIKRAVLRKEHGVPAVSQPASGRASPVPRAEIIAVEDVISLNSRASTPASNRSPSPSPVKSLQPSIRSQFASKLARKISSIAESVESTDASFGDMSEDSFLDMGFTKSEYEEIKRKKAAKQAKSAALPMDALMHNLYLEEHVVPEELAEDLQLELDATASKLKAISGVVAVTSGEDVVQAIQTMTDAKKQLEEEQSSFKAKLDVITADLETTRSTLYTERESNQKTIMRFQDELHALEMILSEKKSEIDSLGTELQGVRQENSNLSQEIRGANFSIQQLKEENSQYAHKVSSLQKEVDFISAQLKETQNDLSHDHETILQEKGTAALMKRENERLVQECTILRTQLSVIQKKARSDTGGASDQVSSLERDLEGKDQEINRLKRVLVDLERELELTKTDKNKMEKDLKHYTKAKMAQQQLNHHPEIHLDTQSPLAEQAIAELTETQGKLQQEKGLREQKEHELSAAEQRILALQSRLSETETKLGSEKESHLQAQTKLKQLEAEVEVLKLSDSFKAELETKHANSVRKSLEMSQKLQEAETKLQQAMENELKFKHEHALSLSQAQTDIDLLKKQVESCKTTMNLQNHELQAIKKGFDNSYVEVLSHQLNIERDWRQKVEMDNNKAMKVLQEMEIDLHEIQFLYNNQVQMTDHLKSQKRQSDELVAMYFDEMSFLQKQLEHIKSQLLGYQQQVVELNRGIHNGSVEIMRLKQSEISLKTMNDGLINDVRELKAQLISSEKRLYDSRSQDKQEIRMLQQQVLESSLLLQNRELQGQQSLEGLEIAKKELAAVKEELNRIQQMYSTADRDRNVTEENSGKIALELERCHFQITSLNDELTRVNEKRNDLEHQLISKSRALIDSENNLVIKKRELHDALNDLTTIKTSKAEAEQQLKTSSLEIQRFIDDLISISRKSTGQFELIQDSLQAHSSCWEYLEQLPQSLQKVADLWKLASEKNSELQLCNKKGSSLVQALSAIFLNMADKSSKVVTNTRKTVRDQIAFESSQLRNEVESLRIELDDREQKLSDAKSQIMIQQQSLHEALSSEKKGVVSEAHEEFSKTKQEVLDLKNTIRTRQNEEVVKQIESLNLQVTSMKSEYTALMAQYQQAQTSWNEEKQSLYSQKNNLMEQGRQYQKTLETLEGMLRGSPVLNQSYPTGSSSPEKYEKIIHVIMKKLKDIQMERKLVEEARNQTEREMKESYERQIQLLMQDIADIKSKLEIAEQKLRRYEGGSVYFHDQSPTRHRDSVPRSAHRSSVKSSSPARLLADRVDQQIAEISVLLKEKHKPNS